MTWKREYWFFVLITALAAARLGFEFWQDELRSIDLARLGFDPSGAPWPIGFVLIVVAGLFALAFALNPGSGDLDFSDSGDSGGSDGD